MKNKFTWLFVIGMQCMAMSSIHAVSDDNVQVGRLSIEQRHAIITKKLENVKKSDDSKITGDFFWHGRFRNHPDRLFI